jgi:hypothetical protein
MLKLIQYLLGPLLINGGLVTTVWLFFLTANRADENYLRSLLLLLLAGVTATLAIPLNIVLSGHGRIAPQTTLSYVIGAVCWVGYICWFWHQMGSGNPKIGG